MGYSWRKHGHYAAIVTNHVMDSEAAAAGLSVDPECVHCNRCRMGFVQITLMFTLCILNWTLGERSPLYLSSVCDLSFKRDWRQLYI